jgi:hypothetical protein
VHHDCTVARNDMDSLGLIFGKRQKNHFERNRNQVQADLNFTILASSRTCKLVKSAFLVKISSTKASDSTN